MFKLFFTLISLSSMVILHGQEVTIKGVLYNKNNKVPIAYATVHVANSKNYRDSDEKGYFEITANKTDSLIFSSIGFETLTIASSLMETIDSIFLKENPITLQEFIITKPIIETFGTVNEKKDRSCGGGSEAERLEVATLIEIPSTIAIYRISKVFIKGKDFKDENPVRLHLYTVDSNGMPGKELLIKEIIIKKKEGDSKIVAIDVKDQNIVVENNSFFVGIQWITSNKVKIFTGPEIFETFKYSKLLTYRRQMNLKNNKWYGWYKNNMIFFPGGIIPQNDTPINVVASAEIEEFSK